MSEVPIPYCTVTNRLRVAAIGQLVKASFTEFSEAHEPEEIRRLYGDKQRIQWFADGYSTWSLVYRVEDRLYRLVTATLVPEQDGYHIHWRVFPGNYQRAGVDETDVAQLQNHISQHYRSPQERPFEPLHVDPATETAYGVSMGESEQQIIARYAGDFDDDE